MPYVFILAVCLRFEWLDNVCMQTQLLNRVWLFCDLMDCTLEGSSVHGIFEARIIILSVLSFRDPISSVQSLSHVQLFMTPWTAACQATLSITNSQSPPKPMSLESVMPSNHLILCCPLLLLPSIFPRLVLITSELMSHWRIWNTIGSPTKIWCYYQDHPCCSIHNWVSRWGVKCETGRPVGL